MSDERKPFRPWIVALLIGLPVLYVASFGPACWWLAKPKPWPHAPTLEFVQPPQSYWPVGWAVLHGPAWFAHAMSWYATLGIDAIAVPTDPDGSEIAFFRC